MVVINKQTMKMLRYIKRKDEPTAEQIIKKFNLESDINLILLCQEGYLLCTKDDGRFTNFVGEKVLSSSYSYKYWATPLTDKYLEEKNSDFHRWLLPTIMAFISLVLSTITFIYTILNNSPISVKLLP